MQFHRTVLAAGLISVFSAFSVFLTSTSVAFAQGSPEPAIQRNINQQQRIETGLRDGSLTTREAARLERGQVNVERMESRALSDGNVSATEQARIKAAQDRQSAAITRERHDAQVGNPNSASSQRMQADVQRNINQQARIQSGVQSGNLTHREAGALERGQARISRAEARAGVDGALGRRDQTRIQRMENNQSAKIAEQKHDAQKR